MALEAGQTNNRYFYAFDLNGSALAGASANFSVSAWKNGAAASPVVAVTEPVASSGRYKVAIDLSSDDTDADWIFEITNATDASDGPWILRDRAFRGSLSDAGIARKALVNRLEVDPNTDTMNLYDDDDTLLLTHVVKDKSGNTINVGTGIPSRRGKGT